MTDQATIDEQTMVQQPASSWNSAENVKEDDVSWKAPLAPPPSPAPHCFSDGVGQTVSASPAPQSEASSDAARGSSKGEALRTLRGALADALSSSLATIAREEVAQQNRQKSGDAAPSRNRDQNLRNACGNGVGSSSSSSSDNRQSSSDNRRHHDGQEMASSGGGPAVVTATTTSSGDDRYSSQSGGNGSNGNDQFNGQGAAHMEGNRDNTWAGPFLRHYQRRQFRARDVPNARDGYGLPVQLEDRHLDERIERRNGNAAHAVVVARLPPPQTETTGSSSFFSSSSEKGSGGEERHNEAKSVGQWQTRIPDGLLPMLSTSATPTMQRDQSHNNRKHSGSESSQSSDGPTAENDSKPRAADLDKGPSQPGPQAIAKKRLRRLSTVNGSSSCDSLVSSADSGSGTEGGYEGSASSNIQQSSCSSPSVSSSEGGSGGNDGVKSMPKREFTTPHHHGTSGELKKRKSKRNHHDGSQSSSSLADFSSGISGGGDKGEGFAAIALSSGSCSPVSSAFSASSDGDGSAGEQVDGRRKMPSGVCNALNSHLPDKHGTHSSKHTSSRRLQEKDKRSIGTGAKRKNHHRSSSRNSAKRTKPTKSEGRRPEADALRPFLKMERAVARSSQKECLQQYHRQGRRRFLNNPTGEWVKSTSLLHGKAAILSLGCDTMAHCLTYLEPPEIHSLLTKPISKSWYDTFTVPQDLWRVLCLSEPFKAKFEGTDDDSSDEFLGTFPVSSDLIIKHLFGKYRLLYTSFVRCMRYLAQIKQDSVEGRPAPSVIDYCGAGVGSHPYAINSQLKNFLAQTKRMMRNRNDGGSVDSSSSNSRASSPANVDDSIVPASNQMGEHVIDGVNPMEANAEVVSDRYASSVVQRKRKKKSESDKKPTKKWKLAPSQITQRLFQPTEGEIANVDLPWSCAIYSIENWMAAFSDVEGIQTMCLRVLPFLLEDETQRTTAQNAGLTNRVLRGMVMFPESVQLHTAAFHTLVLLARPLGGKEGMLFHSSMVNSAGIFSNGQQGGKNGIAVMLDSMRRFSSEEQLQAMSCWSLVNIALAPAQKSVLVKLGGISATANSMMQHPYSAEVQFRALFALINLVIPSVNLTEPTSEQRSMQEQLGEVNDATEKEMLDENVGQIANLVVLAMKNFCSSQTILNRACLVLHNLSLTPEYHEVLLWTPNCYQMLDWCLANYPGDQVLQQSTRGTIHRLQMTLANDDTLRQRFTASIQAQQLQSLEEAQREATVLHDQLAAAREVENVEQQEPRL